MNKIPKCRSKYFIPQANNVKVPQKESIRGHLVPKITQKNLKFGANRQFGKDITNSVNDAINSICNNNNTKIVTFVDKKQSNNVYIKKHSSASQVAQKTQKMKITINENKLRENKSNCGIKKKSDITASEYYYNNTKNINIPQAHQGGSKLHSSISFGINNNKRPLSGFNNCISVRVSNPKNNSKVHSSLNNRSINFHNSNNYSGLINNYYNNNNKIQHTHTNLDLM